MYSKHPPLIGEKTVLFLLLLSFCLFPMPILSAGNADSHIRLLASDAKGVTLEVNLDGFQTQETMVDGTPYQRLWLTRASHTMAIGEPELPVLGQFIAVPANSRVSYEILGDDRLLLSGYRIYPTQKPLSDRTDTALPAFQMRTEAYQRDDLYPGELVEFSEIQTIRDLNVVRIEIHPLQFRASRGELLHHRSLQIRVHYNTPQGLEGFSRSIGVGAEEAFRDVYENLVLNFEDVSRYPAAVEKKEIIIPTLFLGADFLIITPPAFEAAADKLAAWKIKRGISTAVRTTTVTGTTTASIKTYIQNAYTGWVNRPSYVLLLGDVNFIPTYYVTTHPDAGDNYPAGHKTGTDLYYSTMGGATDRLPDIHLGRMPVDTVTEANLAVDKAILYETNPSTSDDYYNTILTAAYFQDRNNNSTGDPPPDRIEDRLFTRTSEDIREYLLTQGYDVTRIYNAESTTDPRWYNDGTSVPVALRKPGYAWNGDAADITGGINAGAFLLFFRGHGSSSGWGGPDYHIDDIADWNNGSMMPVVFSTTCESGWFDSETDGYSYSTRDPSFSERLLRYGTAGTKGAVGVFAATRISYSWHNDALIKGFVDSLYPGFLTYSGASPGASKKTGSILSYGKYYYASVYGTADAYAITTLELYHYFGDPTMRIWTSEPDTMTVSHAATATYGAGSFSVSVSEPWATVTITQNGGIIGSGLTPLTSPHTRVVDLSPDFGADEAYVTVTKDGHRPYQGRVILRPSTPTELEMVANSKTMIWLLWDDNSSSEQGTYVERSLNGTSGWTQIGTTSPNVESIIDTGRTCGTDYYYRVRAYNEAGNSPYSNVLRTNTTECTSTAPTNLILSNATQTSIKLTWGDNSSNETGFRIERSPNGTTFTEIATVGANVETYTSTGLTCNTTYYYRVRSYNAGGNSAYTNIASEKTLECSPAAPTDLTATGQSRTHILLQWKDNSTNENGFEIWTHPGGLGLWTRADTVSANVTSYVDILRSCNASLTYRVRAINDGGNSDYSNTATGTTKPCTPNAPERLEGKALSKTEIHLTWIDNSKDETSFKIEVLLGKVWSTAATVQANVKEYAFSKLVCNMEYTYRVSACNAQGCSDPSNTVKITTFDCGMSGPTNLDASALSSSQIKLTWVDQNTGETGFKIERSLDGTSEWSSIGSASANATTYTDSGLQPSTLYYYRVFAYQSTTNSSYSNVARAKTIASTETIMEFAQIAVGDIWRSFLFLTNPTDTLLRGKAEFFEDDGTPLILNIAGTNRSVHEFHIARNASLKLDLLGATSTVKGGWCRVTAEGELGGLLVYQMLGGGRVASQATVLPSTRLRKFRLPLAYLKERTDIGLAIVNPLGAPTEVVMQYFDMDGAAAAATATGTLNPMHHLARFFWQFIATLPENPGGVVEVSSDSEIIGVGLAFINNYSEFTTIPVIPVP